MNPYMSRPQTTQGGVRPKQALKNPLANLSRPQTGVKASRPQTRARSPTNLKPLSLDVLPAHTKNVYTASSPMQQFKVRHKNQRKDQFSRTLPTRSLNKSASLPSFMVDSNKTILNRLFKAPTQEELDRIDQRMECIRKAKAEQLRMQQRRREQAAEEKKKQEMRYQPRTSEEKRRRRREMVRVREMVYGTANEKDKVRRRHQREMERLSHIRSRPIEDIWDPAEFRRGLAQRIELAEKEDILKTLPRAQPPMRKHSLHWDSDPSQKLGLGKFGFLEGDVQMMVRCENLVLPPELEASHTAMLKVVGFEDDGSGAWPKFGETKFSDDLREPVFSSSFRFPFWEDVCVMLRLQLVLKSDESNKTEVVLGSVEAKLEDVLVAALQSQFIQREDIVVAVEESIYDADWVSIEGEEVGMVKIPLKSENAELSALFKDAGSAMVVVVRIEASKSCPHSFRPKPKKTEDDDKNISAAEVLALRTQQGEFETPF